MALLDTGAGSYQVKRVIRDEAGGRSLLASDNHDQVAFTASDTTTPIATLVQTVRPEQLAPTAAAGDLVPDEGLAATFGLSQRPTHGARVDGHLFFLVEQQGAFTGPDRLAGSLAPDRRPGETAFVLTRTTPDAPWRYAGVARWREDESAWVCPELDLTTWRALGGGREASRRLPPGALDRAKELVDRLTPGWVEHAGKRCRIVGKSPKGGVRIAGDEFKERIVSLTDLAWVLLARDDVEQKGGVLDEARVNRLRYLEGTAKGSTRWIDTGWGLVLIRGEKQRD